MYLIKYTLMRHNKKRNLKEAFNFSTTRKPAPFKISRAGGYSADASDRLKASYLQQKGVETMEKAHDMVYNREIQKIEPLFRNLFDDLMAIRDFLGKEKAQPLMSEKNCRKLEDIMQACNEMNKFLINEIIPMLDDIE